MGEKSLVEPATNILLSLGVPTNAAHTAGSALVIVFLTFLSVVFGEIIPKTIALAVSERIAAFLAIPMSWIAKVAFPIVWIFTKTSQLILGALRLNKLEQAPVSNEEIKELMGQGAEAGVFHESEKELVANVLHMDEKRAATIMTHRGDWVYINLEDEFKNNREKLINNKYSRILVVKGDINNVLGFVHIVDILPKVCSGDHFNIEEHVDAPLYLPETVTTSQVLEQLKRHRKEIAIIVNEYGENIGIITLTDIMSAIVGDISSTDEEKEEEIIKREDGSYLVDGLIAIDKLEQELELNNMNPYPEINTLSGFIMAHAAQVPHVGYKIELENANYKLSIEVMDMDKNCVDKVLIKKDILQEDITSDATKM